MNAEPLDYNKFAKIIALADSDKPGEAAAALRAMRRMLDNAGMRFQDFAELARRPPLPSGASPTQLELQIKGLAKRLREREAEIDRLRREIATWRDLAWSNTEKLSRSNENLTNHVHELKQKLNTAENRPRRNVDKRTAVLRYLEDSELSRLSDREIARRAGVSPQTVCNWRRRLSPGSPKSTQRIFLRGGRAHRMRTANIGLQRQTG